MKCSNVTYFDSFGIEYIPKEIRKIIGNKNITSNIYGIQANDLLKCGYFCVRFIDFMQNSKSFLDDTNLFSPN